MLAKEWGISAKWLQLTLTRRPKATNQAIEISKSIGQLMKVPPKGNSQIMARRMESAARTSV